MSGYGIFVVRVSPSDSRHAVIVCRVEADDAEIENLALRLEGLYESGYIEDFTIEGKSLPTLGTAASIFMDIAKRWTPGEQESLRISWDNRWRNRDPYFVNNAKRRIR